jgi:hypothetical protein
MRRANRVVDYAGRKKNAHEREVYGDDLQGERRRARTTLD